MTSRAQLSCVMPCRNERGDIESAISSLLNQMIPRDRFELIVVDGLSDDGTGEILNRLAKLDDRLTVITNEARFTASAMNLGIQTARGEYVAIVGAHNTYDKDYLSTALAILSSRPEVDNVGGAIQFNCQTPFQYAVARAFRSPLGSGGAKWHDENYEGPADTVFGGVYRRTVFERIGYFDERLLRNQDDELNFRLTQAGGIIWKSSQMISHYSPRTTLLEVLRQYYQYGFWKVRLITKHRKLTSYRSVAPLMLLLTLAIGGGYVIQSGAYLTALLASAIAYVVVAAADHLTNRRAEPWLATVMVPIVIGAFHIGYGLGFAHGLLAHKLGLSDGAQISSLTRGATRRD